MISVDSDLQPHNTDVLPVAEGFNIINIKEQISREYNSTKNMSLTRTFLQDLLVIPKHSLQNH